MRNVNFKIGENVRIRQWDDMVDEFGFSLGRIPCKHSFVPKMKHLCGKEITIDSIIDDTIQNIQGYRISFDMIEKIEKKGGASMKKINLILPKDVKAVFFNGNNTTVEIVDGRKGTATCSESDTFDPYPGFCMAYFKAKFSSNFKLKKTFESCLTSAKKKGYKTAILLNK